MAGPGMVAPGLSQAVTGDLEAGATSVVCGDVGELAIEGKEVKLGDPFIFDINNIYDFDF